MRSRSRPWRTGRFSLGAITPIRIQGHQQLGRVRGPARWAKPSIWYGSSRSNVQRRLPGYGCLDQGRIWGQRTSATGYYHVAPNTIARFEKAPMEHIPRQENKQVDALSWLSITKKKSHQRSIMQIWLRHPSVSDTECLTVINTMPTVGWPLSSSTSRTTHAKKKTRKPWSSNAQGTLCWTRICTEEATRPPLLKCITQ